MKIDDITIPIFDGADYSNWKKRILKFLEYKKCKNVVTREKLSTDQDKNWKEAEIKATNYIYSAISNKQLEYIGDLDSAYKILKKFDEMYLKESTALQIVCRNNLECIKLKNFSEVTLFFDEYEKAINELKAAGAIVTEQEKLRYMIKALPQSYSHIGDLIDVLPETDRTVDYLKSKIKLKSIEEKNQTEKNEENATKSNTFMSESRGKCFQCGKPGHYQKDCYFYSTGQRGRGGTGQYRRWSRCRGNQSRGNRGFRGRGFYRGAANQGQQRESQYGNGNSFITQVNTSEVNGNNNRADKNKISWILDSGCTDHIVNDDRLFNEYTVLKEPIEVKLGDGRELKATKIGKIITEFEVFERKCEITLFNVFYVKDMKQNLISYSKVTMKNKIVSYGNIAKIYNQNNELIATARKENNLYYMTSFMNNYYSNGNKEINFSIAKNESEEKMSLKEKWHRKLGHVNFNYLDVMCKNKLLNGVPEKLESEYMKCAICIENKMHNLPFKNNRSKAQEILEIVHTDLNGPHRTIGNCGEKYFISFIDDYSKLAKVYCIKSKDQVIDCFIEYVNEIQNVTGRTIKELRCDNGTEYLNGNMFQFARQKGIVIKPCPAYVHELNGTAERFNRSIMDMARCLLAEANIDRRFWPEVVKTAAYLKNRTLANTVERKTPYEIFFRRRPCVKNLRMYGSRVFVRIPEVKRESKWDKKAELGILLGYTDVGYRVLINNRVIVARHVDIIENDVKCIGFKEENQEEESKSESDQSEDEMMKNEDSGLKTKKNSTEEISLRRSTRKGKAPLRFNEQFDYSCIQVNYCNATAPDTFDEAITCNEANQWKTAMNREINSIIENNTWKLVSKPKEKKVLDVKWVYKKKSENIYKARLVVKGFQQKEEIENTYSPVAKTQTLKILLSYCCQNSLNIDQMDVETAFLNGKVTSEVYIKQPLGYENGTDKVYRLIKSLYGLKESPRSW